MTCTAAVNILYRRHRITTTLVGFNQKNIICRYRPVRKSQHRNMKIVITGAAGFLGSRLADELLSASCPLRPSSLLLADRAAPPARADPRVRTLALDLAAPGAADRLVSADTAVLFHLAAVVSGQAEEDFDLGMRVNLDATRALLETVRRRAPRLVLVFASSVAVFGGEGPVDERTAPAPETSYGAAKAAAELLVADHSRRGFVDGRSARLPTVTVRAGAANAAVTSFASAVVREPLRGRRATVPVAASRSLWVTSPGAAVRNLVRLALVPGAALGSRRALNLPGLRVSVGDMVAALAAAAGEAATALLDYEPDDVIDKIIATLPTRFDVSLALGLGLETNVSFGDIVQEYVTEQRS